MDLKGCLEMAAFFSYTQSLLDQHNTETMLGYELEWPYVHSISYLLVACGACFVIQYCVATENSSHTPLLQAGRDNS